MIILYIVLLTLAVIALGSIIPIIQVLFSRKTSPKMYKYVFSEDLINRDIQLVFRENLAPRTLLATRGWVRGPQGELLTQNAFEEKKFKEYSIELP